MDKPDGKVAIVTSPHAVSAVPTQSGSPGPVPRSRRDISLRSYEEFEAEKSDMTAETTVAEIEAMGGAAIGIEGRCD
jgi:hypothetical protein